jgi:hypothetical protein
MKLRFNNELGLERLPGLALGIAEKLAPTGEVREEITHFLVGKCLEIASDYIEVLDDPARRTSDTLVLVARLRFGDLRDRLAFAATQFAAGKVAQAHDEASSLGSSLS